MTHDYTGHRHTPCIMGGANYLREIVSGKKARFIDHETATNLDLVYVTDRIIM